MASSKTAHLRKRTEAPLREHAITAGPSPTVTAESHVYGHNVPTLPTSLGAQVCRIGDAGRRIAGRELVEGMPVKKEGRFVTAKPDELNAWLGRESGGEPVHVASEATDLSAELKRGLSFVRGKKR